MKLVLALGMLLVIQACNRSGENEANRRVRQDTVVFTDYGYSSPLVSISKRKAVLQQQEQRGAYTLQYFHLDEQNRFTDTVTYQLGSDSVAIHTGQESQAKVIEVVDTLQVYLEGKNYSVYKYAVNFNRIDGCSTHFWVPQLGIILIRSTTWRSFSMISRPISPSQDELMRHLQNIVFQNQDFYFWCRTQER